eukprot:3941593-Rhodomonas_salina.1
MMHGTCDLTLVSDPPPKKKFSHSGHNFPLDFGKAVKFLAGRTTCSVIHFCMASICTVVRCQYRASRRAREGRERRGIPYLGMTYHPCQRIPT